MYRVVAKLWNHEVQRLYSDRIVSDETRSEVYRLISEVSKDYYCSTVLHTDRKSTAIKLGEDFTGTLPQSVSKYIRAKLSEEFEEIEVGVD